MARSEKFSTKDFHTNFFPTVIIYKEMTKTNYKQIFQLSYLQFQSLSGQVQERLFYFTTKTKRISVGLCRPQGINKTDDFDE